MSKALQDYINSTLRRGAKNEPLTCHLQLAKRVIVACEAELGRELSVGERADLLMDNTQWDLPFVKKVLARNWRGEETMV